MGKIIYVEKDYERFLPKGDFYLGDYPSMDRIKPDRVKDVFDKGRPFESNFVDLLFNNLDCVVYHVDPSNIGKLREDSFIRPVMMGVSYRFGHSECKNKTLINDVSSRRGPFVLFNPPGANQKTFYLQHPYLPSFKPEFEEYESNPLKIEGRFLYLGDAFKIFEDFKKKGYDFKNYPMDLNKWDELENLD